MGCIYAKVGEETLEYECNKFAAEYVKKHYLDINDSIAWDEFKLELAKHLYTILPDIPALKVIDVKCDSFTNHLFMCTPYQIGFLVSAIFQDGDYASIMYIQYYQTPLTY